MKKFIVLLMALTAAGYLQAQPSAGNLFVGGSVGFSTSIDKTKSGGTTHKDATTLNITVLPMAGYFLSDRIAVGARLGVDAEITKRPDNVLEKSTNTSFVINPFGRYYLISDKGGLFAEASVMVAPGSTKNHFENTTTKSNTMFFSVGVAPGVYYYITEKLALEAKFGWLGFETNVSESGNDVKDINNFFGLDISPDQFSFGLTYTL